MSRFYKVLAGLFLVSMVLLSFSSCSTQEKASPKSSLSISIKDGKTICNGTETWSWPLEEGKTGILKISPKISSGHYSLRVTRDGDEVIYDGHDFPDPFTLSLKEKGNYNALVTYQDFCGSIGQEWSVKDTL